jgi:SAM-dependent methyltransferase
MTFNDHFSSQASGYAKARPTYPAALFAELARLAPRRALAWDAGSGNGQAAVALAGYFDRVVATEPSAAQLAAASPHPHVSYHQAAEKAPMLQDASVDLLTVAQAAHWFDLAAYYAEARRVARPGAVVALWTYGLCAITPAVDAAIHRFYSDVVGPYWPPERVHCMNGYRDLEFPFRAQAFPAVTMELDWDAGALLDYVATWSAVVRYRKERCHDPLPQLRAELLSSWGDPGVRRRIVWPLTGWIGTVEADTRG